jgi:fimbrial chaperone protein
MRKPRSAAPLGALLTVVALFATLPTEAGSLRLDRTRLELTAGARVAELNVSNAGSEPTLIQTQVFSWSQQNGTDELTPSPDLLVSPPIFEIPPGASQLLRVGLLASSSSDQEAPYRLILQEVPRPADGDEGAAVSVLLRISFPIFVQPAVPVAPVLDWHAARTATGGIQLTLSNSGNGHVKVRGLEVALPDGTPLAKKESFMTYVLPGETCSWDLPTEAPWSGTRLQLSAETEQGRVHADLEVEGGS